MSIGQGSIGFLNLQSVQSPPFNPASANDGLMVDPVTGKIILGEPNATPGTPSQFLAAKDLVTKGFLFRVGDVDFSANGTHFSLDDANRRWLITSGTGDMLDLDQGNGVFFMGDISAAVNNTVWEVDDAARMFRMKSGGFDFFKLDVPGSTATFENSTDDLNFFVNPNGNNNLLFTSNSEFLVYQEVANKYFTFDQFFDGGGDPISGMENNDMTAVNAAGFRIQKAASVSGNTHASEMYANTAATNARAVLDGEAVLFFTDCPIQTGFITAAGDNGKWKLGKSKAAAVVMDAANYIEVEIEGVIVKLAIAL